ncbi:hypothetical protein KR067_005106 [Drosophila pandora]|nr:hypothetical protein KR067_005106 [Drosophila pandora]
MSANRRRSSSFGCLNAKNDENQKRKSTKVSKLMEREALSLPLASTTGGIGEEDPPALEMPRICRCCCKRDLELFGLFEASKPTLLSTCPVVSASTYTSTPTTTTATTTTTTGKATTATDTSASEATTSSAAGDTTFVSNPNTNPNSSTSASASASTSGTASPTPMRRRTTHSTTTTTETETTMTRGRSSDNPIDYALSGAHSSMDIVLEEMIIWMLNINRDDGLPQEICRQCMAQFLMVAKFRRKCVRMQQRLQDFAQEISDRQAARQAKRDQKQRQLEKEREREREREKQTLQRQRAEEAETEKETEAEVEQKVAQKGEETVTLPVTERKRRMVSESEGAARTPGVKYEIDNESEDLPPPKTRRLQLRLRKLRSISTGSDMDHRDTSAIDASNMPWKTKAARKEISELWSASPCTTEHSSPPPNTGGSDSEAPSTNSTSSSSDLSDMSVGPCCGFASDHHPTSPSISSSASGDTMLSTSFLEFPRTVPDELMPRRGRRPRNAPIYTPAKRARRSFAKKSMEVGPVGPAEENTKSDEVQEGLATEKSHLEDEKPEMPAMIMQEEQAESKDNSNEESSNSNPLPTGDKIEDDSTSDTPNPVVQNGNEPVNTIPETRLSNLSESSTEIIPKTSPEESTPESASRDEPLQSEELTSSTESGEKEPKSPEQAGIIVSIPLNALNEDLHRRLCTEPEAEAEAEETREMATTPKSDDVNNNANGENFCQSATADSFNSAVALRTDNIEATPDCDQEVGANFRTDEIQSVAETPPDKGEEEEEEVQPVRSGPTPMDFMAEFAKHCENGVEQLKATTPAPSPTPSADTLALPLNDLESKQQLEVEMNDVENTLNGILNEMQDQHMYTPTCSHIDEFLTPADYAPLTEQEPSVSPPNPDPFDQSMVVTTPPAKATQNVTNPFDNSNFSNELIGFQNDIPCFENIASSPESDQSLHLELTQFLKELQPSKEEDCKEEPQDPQESQAASVADNQTEPAQPAIPDQIQIEAREDSQIESQSQMFVQTQVFEQNSSENQFQIQSEVQANVQAESPPQIQSQAIQILPHIQPQVHQQLQLQKQSQDTTTTVTYEQIYEQHIVQQTVKQSSNKVQLISLPEARQWQQAQKPQPHQQQQQHQHHHQQQQQQQQLQWSSVGGLEAVRPCAPMESVVAAPTTTTYYISTSDLYPQQQTETYAMLQPASLDSNDNYMLEQQHHHHHHQHIQRIQHQRQHPQSHQQVQQQQRQQRQPIMILIQPPDIQRPVASASNPQQAPLHIYGAPAIRNEVQHLQHIQRQRMQQQQQQQHHQQQQQLQQQRQQQQQQQLQQQLPHKQLQQSRLIRSHPVVGMPGAASISTKVTPMPATTPGGRALTLKCRFCQNGPRFSNSLEYSRHIIDLHPAVAPFNCPHCPLAFAGRNKRSQHILDHHVVQQYQCGQCSQVFPAQRALDVHIQRFHIASKTSPAEGGAGNGNGNEGVRVEEVQLQIANEQQQQHAQQLQQQQLQQQQREERMQLLQQQQLQQQQLQQQQQQLQQQLEQQLEQQEQQQQQQQPMVQQPQSPHPSTMDVAASTTTPRKILCCPDCEDCTSGHSHFEELSNLQAPPTVPTPPSTIVSAASPQPMMSMPHITMPSPEQSEPDSTTTLRQYRKRGVIVGPHGPLHLATPVASPSASPSSSPSSSTVDVAPPASPAPPQSPATPSPLPANELRATQQCQYCEERFTNELALKKHHQLAHGSTTTMPFVCGICKRGYRMRTALHRHMESHDVEGRPYECNLCKVRFPRPSQLTLHKITVHLLTKPHTCDECGKQFGTESALKTHVKFHGELGYQCDECDKSFEYLRELRKHRRTHTKLFYKCDICPRDFMHFQSFRAHMNTHLPLGVYLNDDATASKSNNSRGNKLTTTTNDNLENPSTPIDEINTPLTPMSIGGGAIYHSTSDEYPNSVESSALESIAPTP